MRLSLALLAGAACAGTGHGPAPAAPAAPAPSAGPAPQLGTALLPRPPLLRPPAPLASSPPADDPPADTPPPVDDLHAFLARWPALDAALARSGADALLWDVSACDQLDPKPAGTVPRSMVSPDGTRSLAVTSLALDAKQRAALGVIAPRPADADGLSLFAIVLDGPSAKVWAHPLNAFLRCSFSGALDWSDDGARVFIRYDSGHGERIALVDVAGRALRFEAFAGSAPIASPNLEHVAWLPWFSGYPFADRAPDKLDGDELSIDDVKVWGSTGPGAARVWDIAWQTDTRLTFCGRTPTRPPRRYRATLAGHTAKVAPDSAPCPPEPRGWY